MQNFMNSLQNGKAEKNDAVLPSHAKNALQNKKFVINIRRNIQHKLHLISSYIQTLFDAILHF